MKEFEGLAKFKFGGIKKVSVRYVDSTFIHCIVYMEKCTSHFSPCSDYFADLYNITKLSLEELPELLVHDNMLIRKLAEYTMDRLK